eukprot:COSAG06_NODE_5707_length_3311_cov_7.978518_1_plen_70_part_00
MKAALLARIESWKGNWQRQIGEDFGEGDLRDDNHLKARNVLLHPQLVIQWKPEQCEAHRAGAGAGSQPG